MGWIQNWCLVYDQNLEEIKAETKGLLPIGYIEQAAQLEVWIDPGCFEYARVLPKSESMTRKMCIRDRACCSITATLAPSSKFQVRVKEAAG